MITADREAVMIGYNMSGLDNLAIKDAALRCGAQLLFDVAPQQMDLHKSQIVKAIKNSSPEGCGRCRTDLQSLRHIIELATPDYFKDVAVVKILDRRKTPQDVPLFGSNNNPLFGPLSITNIAQHSVFVE